MLGVLGRVVTFELEACRQWMLVSVQITRHYPAQVLFTFTVHKYIYHWSFCVSVIHRTLTWTTGSLIYAYVIILMCAYIYIQTGVGHTDNKSAPTLLTRKNSQIFLVLLMGFELWSLMS